MTQIEARLRGRLGEFALDVDFTTPARGVTALFGPSGCGKTTTLRAIAGLQRFAEGRVVAAGEVWQDGAAFRPVAERPIGYVFQEASLFAHLSVRANLDYGRRRALKGGAVETVHLDEAVALLGLGRLLDRRPATLSGGERQRVALARALLSQPKLLLMDEPLAALDRPSKEEILPYLERLRDQLAIPALYVSHDIAEVERLADRVVLMREGRVEAAGPLSEIQARTDLALAQALSASVTLEARVLAWDAAYGLATLGVPGGTLTAPGAYGPVGALCRLRIAASDVSLLRETPQGSSVLNFPPARIVSAERQGAAMLTVVLALGEAGQGARILARITRLSWDRMGLAPGQAALAQIKGVALVSAQVSPGGDGAETALRCDATQARGCAPTGR